MLFDKSKPDFINEKGTKWWFDKSSTNYARKEDAKGITLPNVSVFYVEEINGNMSYVVIDGEDIIYESKQLEAIGAYIDILKFNKQKGES